MRMLCGYFTLLSNLNEIKIYSEYTQQRTAKLACIALVYLFIHRLCHLYQGLGRNLQALVDKAEYNHYVAARCLESIYRCLQLLRWSTTRHPILQQLVRVDIYPCIDDIYGYLYVDRAGWYTTVTEWENTYNKVRNRRRRTKFRSSVSWRRKTKEGPYNESCQWTPIT